MNSSSHINHVVAFAVSDAMTVLRADILVRTT